MTDITAQLEQLQAQVQAQTDSLRARAAEIERGLAGQQVQGRARDGAITVTATGLGRIVDVQIAPGLIGRTPGDEIGNLVVAAVSEARVKAAQLASEASRTLTVNGEPLDKIAPDWLTGGRAVPR